MNEPKPFASLSPSLLARKGGARPAMRPQLASLHQFQGVAARQIEDDLGWNDMGDTEIDAPNEVAGPAGLTVPIDLTRPLQLTPPIEAEAQIVQLKPHGLAGIPEGPDVFGDQDVVADRPEVLRQQEEVAERIAASAPARKRRGRRSALSEGRRAAFTLRLDQERHMRLRLACTLTGCSAQQLVTDALDKLISELPDVSAMAAKVSEGRK